MRLLSVALTVVALSFSSQCYSQAAPGTECSPRPEPLFQLMIDSVPLELHSTAVGSFAVVPVDKLAQVRIHAGFDVRWVDVRPFSAGVHASIAPNHRDVSFPVSDNVPLTVEFNDDLSHVVHLFLYDPAQVAPASSDPKVRYFGPGLHEAGVIELQTGQTVYLAAGAWVKGAIRAKGAKNIAIRGFGVLDGSGMDGHAAPYGGRSPIYLEASQDALVEGITIVNSHDWTVHLRQSDGAHINGIKILNPGSWNGDDGIDLVSSSHVLVENVFVRTNDDCVVVKNLADVDTSDITVRHSVCWNMPNGGNGLEIGFENRSHRTHDIRFKDIDMIHIERGSAISIHNGDSGVVEDIVYDDIRVEDIHRKLIDFAVLYAPYGPDRPSRQEEIRERMDRGGTWDAVLCYLQKEKEELSLRRGSIRNIRVSRLRVVGGSLPYSVIAGFDHDHNISQVDIEDIEYQGSKLRDASALKLVQEHASGIVIR